MKPAAFDHVAPASIEQALALLSDKPQARLLAGGQSLVPMLALRLVSPALLIDLNRIPGLSGIRLNDSNELVIGAMTRHRAVERSELVARINPLLTAAMPWIAHVQIRNRGTIGGSLAHADPAAELPAVCVACEATLVAQSARGRRDIPAADFFRGMFETALAEDEILTEMRFPAWPKRRRSAFLEISRRHGDFAICGIAAVVDPGHARIVAFGVTDVPVRLRFAERALVEQGVAAAARVATKDIQARSDHHASAAYRLELLEVLTERALS